MKRGEIWTASGGAGYAGKSRPVVIVQDDSFDATGSITFCPLTTNESEAPLFRLLIEPSQENGLRSPCRLMVDKLMTIERSKLGVQIGTLSPEDMVRLNQAILVFLGLASSTRATKP